MQSRQHATNHTLMNEGIPPALDGRRPTVSVRTIGCRLNQAETALLLGHFATAGYDPLPFGQPCDVTVIHGCAITQRAQRESLQSVRQARRRNPGTVVILAGCPAEVPPVRDAADTEADLVVGQIAKMHLPALLHQVDPARFPTAARTGLATPYVDTRRAYIKIQDGCDFHCTYCLVPAVRGAPVSRPLQAIVSEATRLAEAGFREVVLAGANLGCYRDGTRGLSQLLEALEAIPAVERIRLGSVEPLTAEEDVVDCMRQSPKLCRFLHLPLQSGDDQILASMGRRYRSADYQRAAEYAVRHLPLLGLGTDVIVGFPGESDSAFRRTLRLIEELPFSNVHVFPYSRRPGTPAAVMPGQVPDAVKSGRARELRELAAAKRAAYAAAFTGRNVCMLVEKVLPSGLARGWTAEYLEASCLAPAARTGELLRFAVSRAEGARLVGGPGATPPS